MQAGIKRERKKCKEEEILNNTVDLNDCFCFTAETVNEKGNLPRKKSKVKSKHGR